MAACKANDQSALGGIPGVGGRLRSGLSFYRESNRADSALELFSNYKAPTVSEAKRRPWLAFEYVKEVLNQLGSVSPPLFDFTEDEGVAPRR